MFLLIPYSYIFKSCKHGVENVLFAVYLPCGVSESTQNTVQFKINIGYNVSSTAVLIFTDASVDTR